MKYLLVALVVAVGLWLWAGARRRDRAERAPARPAAPGTAEKGQPLATMLACAHCGVHLPAGDALLDTAGRPFCTEAHRLAGPR